MYFCRVFLCLCLALMVVFLVPAASSAPPPPDDATGAAQAEGYYPVLTLPDTIYAVVGRPVAIHYNQLTAQVPAAAAFIYSCTCDSGAVDASGFTFTPRGPGSTTVRFGARDPVAGIETTVTTRVRAVIGNRPGGERTALFVGDSLFAAHPAAAESSYVVTDVRLDFLADGGWGIRLLGTAGAAPGRHEGYNGRSWYDFISAPSSVFTNPFWDTTAGRLDFQKYMAASGQAGPIDYCVVQLAYNDVFACGGAVLTPMQLNAWMTRIDGFCSALLSEDRGYPDCRIVLSLPSSGNISQDAWLCNYGSLTGWEAYETNLALYRMVVRGRYDGAAFDARVSVCASGVFVDRVTGYPVNNYCHPNRNGYESMAAAFYAHLRALNVPPAAATGVNVAPAPVLAVRPWPNPCNPRTTIGYRLSESGRARLAIHDIRGARVKVLVDADHAAGEWSVTWDGTRDGGGRVPSGTYLARLWTAAGERTTKLTVVR